MCGGWPIATQLLFLTSRPSDEKRLLWIRARKRSCLSGILLFTLGHLIGVWVKEMSSTKEPTWIATRLLTDPQGGPSLEVRIGIPALIEPPDCWECPYALVEPGQVAAPQTAYGSDAFQALMQAIEAIRVMLTRTGRPLTWLNFEAGFTGFTRLIPFTFGLESVREMEASVDNIYERHAREAIDGKRRRPYGEP